MSSLNDSLRIKANVKGPSVTGPVPVSNPDTPSGSGRSGGISAAKTAKNTGSTSPKVGAVKINDSSFLQSLGGSTQSDKTGGYH